MPSLGQFTEGYLLLVTKDHVECVAEAADGNFADVKERVADVLEDVYGTYGFFEHGRIGSCYQQQQNRICFHAHLHALPLPTDFSKTVERDFEGRSVDSITELANHRERNPHYLYVETADGRKRFFDVDSDIERQYLRKRACKSLGLPTEYADWKRYPFREKMERTTDELRNHLSEGIPITS
jgi:diadenosine tetraphosphate (Ap4A) HIT family hydrolase